MAVEQDVLRGDAQAAPEVPALKLFFITLSMMCVAIMQALDMTVANVALPHMQGTLSASHEQIAWVLTSYAVATAIAMPFAGWLAERYGRSKVLLWSVVGFTIASILCGLSESLAQIVIARVLQGALGAGLIPLSQAVIIQTYPPARMRRGLAIWSSGTMIAPILGPTFGGLLTDTIGWPWVFYINIPFSILAILGILTYLPKDAPNPKRRLDFFGFITLTLAVGALQACLDRGQHLDWFDSTEIRIEACIVLVALSFLIAHTMWARGETFFDKRLLRDRNYSACLVGMGVAGGILSSSRALIPLMLQSLFFYSAFDTGLVLGPTGIGAVLAITTYARWANAIDNRIFMGIGMCLVAGSLWAMSGYNLAAASSSIVWPNFIQGAGMILFMTPMSALAFSTLPHHLLNEGGTVFYLARNIGGSLAISITQAVVLRNTTLMHANLAEHVTPFNNSLSMLPVPHELGAAVLDAEITRQATMTGYIDAFILLLIAIVATAPLLFLLRMPKHTQPVSPQLAME